MPFDSRIPLTYSLSVPPTPVVQPGYNQPHPSTTFTGPAVTSLPAAAATATAAPWWDQQQQQQAAAAPTYTVAHSVGQPAATFSANAGLLPAPTGAVTTYSGIQTELRALQYPQLFPSHNAATGLPQTHLFSTAPVYGSSAASYPAFQPAWYNNWFNTVAPSAAGSGYYPTYSASFALANASPAYPAAAAAAYPAAGYNNTTFAAAAAATATATAAPQQQPQPQFGSSPFAYPSLAGYSSPYAFGF